MKSTPIKICKKCGREIFIIPAKMYRSITVDADAIPVVADSLGEEFIRVDGTKVKARELKIDEEAHGEEYAYRPHKWTCGIEE